MQQQIEFRDYMVYPPEDKYRFADMQVYKKNWQKSSKHFKVRYERWAIIKIRIQIFIFLSLIDHNFISHQITFMQKICKPFMVLLHPMLEAACWNGAAGPKPSDSFRKAIMQLDSNIKSMETIRNKHKPRESGSLPDGTHTITKIYFFQRRLDWKSFQRRFSWQNYIFLFTKTKTDARNSRRPSLRGLQKYDK